MSHTYSQPFSSIIYFVWKGCSQLVLVCMYSVNVLLGKIFGKYLSKNKLVCKFIVQGSATSQSSETPTLASASMCQFKKITFKWLFLRNSHIIVSVIMFFPHTVASSVQLMYLYYLAHLISLTSCFLIVLIYPKTDLSVLSTPVFKCPLCLLSAQVHSQTWSPQISSSPTLQTGMCALRWRRQRRVGTVCGQTAESSMQAPQSMSQVRIQGSRTESSLFTRCWKWG